MADDQDIFAHIAPAGGAGDSSRGDIFGHVQGAASQTDPNKDYSGYDSPTLTPPPLPLATPAGKTRGTVLPFMRDDKTGALEWAVPDFLASPLRGAVAIGQEALGERPVNDPSVRGDIIAAASFGAGAAPAGVVKSVTAAPPALRPMYEFVSRMTGGDISQNPAALRLVKRLEQDSAGGGVTAQDMIDMLNQTPNKPQSVLDVAGENTLALGGKVARQPGPWRQTLTKWLNDRDRGAGPRLDHDITAALGQEGGTDAFDALVKARSIAAKPLFAKADEGGSIAPLETQFRNAFNEASAAEKKAAQDVVSAESHLNAKLAKQPVTRFNDYADSAANEQVAAARAGVAKARAELERAQTAKEGVLEMLRQAQEDIATGKPGAVWNPRIQEFLDNPRVKAGIRKGWTIERDDALAEGRPINATEYAVVGEDANGDPTVGKVPTMRLLRIAKQGLDRMVMGDEYRSKLTGELNTEGVAIDKVRAEFLKELDKVNPDYAAARAQWSGDSQSLEAFKLGEKLFKTNPREITKRVADMTPNDKEFLRLGAARLLRDEVAKKGITGDEAKAIVRSDYTRQQLRPLFDSDRDYERFINGVEAEGRMFGTRYAVLGNSKTAAREMEDVTPELDALASATKSGKHFSAGNLLGGISHGMDALGSLVSRRDPAINTELARMMTTELNGGDPARRLAALKEILAHAGPVGTDQIDFATPAARFMVPASGVLSGALSPPQQDQQP